MLWSQIVDRASIPFEPSDEIKQKAKKYGEEAQQDFAFHTKSYERTRGVFIDKDDREVELPSDFIELASYVEFRNRVLDIYPEHQKFPQRDSNGVYRTGTPIHYQIKGNSLCLYPSPHQSGMLLFNYVATINNLEDSATAYKKLKYTNLKSGYWRIGKKIQGVTSGATAIISEDINDNTTGTLIITDIVESNSGSFQAAEQIVQIDEEQVMELQQQNTFNDLLANWDTIGLGARATTSGLCYSFGAAGDKPAMLEAYHPMIIDYIKAMLYEDLGRYDISDRHMSRYMNNRQIVKGQFANRERYGSLQIQNAL